MENMQTKKFTDIDIVNRVRMRYYYLNMPDSDELCISGNNGYPEYYRMEIFFEEVEYIACGLYIDESYQWRLASPEERKSMLEAFAEFPDVEESYSHTIVYCLEEMFPPLGKGPRKYFVAAHSVEIVLYYDANNPRHLAGLDLLDEQRTG
jgi:hypothetical protein